MNGNATPHSQTATYLGMTLDAKLRRKVHVIKTEDLGLKYRKMYWLMGRRSALSTQHNTLLLYKHVLKPVWPYGIQLWGCTNRATLL
jgi:hypothetical protein